MERRQALARVGGVLLGASVWKSGPAILLVQATSSLCDVLPRVGRWWHL